MKKIIAVIVVFFTSAGFTAEPVFNPHVTAPGYLSPGYPGPTNSPLQQRPERYCGQYHVPVYYPVYVPVYYSQTYYVPMWHQFVSVPIYQQPTQWWIVR